MFFQNREDAGIRLGQALQKYKNDNPIVLGVPRGGVVVAAKVAEELEAPLDVIISRKIGAPHNPEVAIGAVTQDGTVIKDEAMVELLGVSDFQIRDMANLVSAEISRRVDAYRGGRAGHGVHNRTVIVIDDGIATGFTIKAALQSVRKANPSRLVLAVPVAPPETVKDLRSQVDDLVCLEEPNDFYAVGQFFQDFDQTSDEEVIELLAKHGK